MTFPLDRFPLAGRWIDLGEALDSTRGLPTKEEWEATHRAEIEKALASDPPARCCVRCGVEILANRGNYCKRCRRARSKTHARH